MISPGKKIAKTIKARLTGPLFKNLLAIGFGILLIILIESSLAIIGIGRLYDEDPFIGFEGSTPLFVAESTSSPFLYSRNPSKDRYFNQQVFTMPKPENYFRIMSFGGSTTYGRPYINNTSFPFWTALILGRYDTQHTYENINAGGISYASYRVKRLMEELAAYEPDLYILYSGHNEFLEKRTFENISGEHPALRNIKLLLHHSRIYSLLYWGIKNFTVSPTRKTKTILGEEVEAVLEDIGGPELYHRDPVFKAGVIEQYRFNIEAIARLCKENRIPIIFCTIPSNLAGISPFKSEHKANLSRNDLEIWTKSFLSGQAALKANLPSQALAYFSVAEAIDDEYALLHFLKGNALLAISRWEEALTSFNRAKEEDIVPLRALDVFNTIIRQVAHREKIPLADIEKVFQSISPWSIPGSNLFIDHVHPTLAGQQLIGKLIVDTAVTAGLVPLSKRAWEKSQTDVELLLRKHFEEISPRYQAMGYWGVGRLYYWAGKYDEAYNSLKEAWKTVKDIWEIPYKLGKLELSRGGIGPATKYLEAAKGLNPDNPNILSSLADTLIIAGDGEKAFLILKDLRSARWGSPEYNLAMSEALRLMGKTDEAANELAAAEKFAGEAPQIHQQIASAYARLGNIKHARDEYRKYLHFSRHPDPEKALSNWVKAIQIPLQNEPLYE